MPGSEPHKPVRALGWGEAKPGGIFGLIYDTWLDTYVWLSLFFGGLIFGFGLFTVLGNAPSGQWLAAVGAALLILGVILFVVRARKPAGWGSR